MKCDMIYLRFVIFVMAVLFVPAIGTASDTPLAGFDHLLQIVKNEHLEFDAEKITPILDYVTSDHYTKEPQPQIAGVENNTYAYCGYESEGGLARLLKYCYNPDIPSCAVMPSVIRLSAWKDYYGNPAIVSPSLWQHLERDDKPVVIRGMYYMQNTPDLNTGAYYGYDSYRAVILMNYKGRKALVSVLKQKDVSDVGKKGFIIGDESEMDYFYSGEQGLTVKGLGWVKSYLYDSFSVSVFVEDKKGEALLRCGVFKWIRAGWAGKNIARKSQVKKGMERYATEFKNLMGKKNFPSPDELVDICNSFKSLSTDEMKKRVERLIQSMHVKCVNGPSCPKVIESGEALGQYVNKLSRAELSSALIVDYIKTLNNRSDKTGNIALKPIPGRRPEVF